MKSAKCTNCGFVGWSDAEVCKKCGAAICAEVGNVAEPMSGTFTSSYSPYGVTFEPELKKGLAVAALVIGILNFFLFGIFVVPVIVGIVISIVALNKVKRYPQEYGGKSLAIGGLVTNIVTAVCLVPVLIIAAIAIPNLLAARRAANEGATIRFLRHIHESEATYQARAGRGNYGTLTDLENSSLISGANDLANGEKLGYRFKVEVVDAAMGQLPAFQAVAVPTNYGSSGKRSFLIDESGVLRGADLHGLEANRSTPPINFNRDYPPESRSERRRSASYGDDE